MALIKPEMTWKDGGGDEEGSGAEMGSSSFDSSCYNIKTGAGWTVINRIIHKDAIDPSSGRGLLQILPKDESSLLPANRTAWKAAITRPDLCRDTVRCQSEGLWR